MTVGMASLAPSDLSWNTHPTRYCSGILKHSTRIHPLRTLVLVLLALFVIMGIVGVAQSIPYAGRNGIFRFFIAQGGIFLVYCRMFEKCSLNLDRKHFFLQIRFVWSCTGCSRLFCRVSIDSGAHDCVRMGVNGVTRCERNPFHHLGRVWKL
ncbi:hypothetical protein BJ741DRAFT_617465 [Chytriomyces cf. hyalinus JEL632]|nr:hypothetical protein BJ741DRAFT_617465 [Chytriomyces cf. hyalinus JEL632]